MKTIKGWFIYAEDFEYGPTLVRWNKEGKPTHRPMTSCDDLDDPDWDEVCFFDEGDNAAKNWADGDEWDQFNPVYAEITVSTKGRTEVE